MEVSDFSCFCSDEVIDPLYLTAGRLQKDYFCKYILVESTIGLLFGILYSSYGA